MTLYEEALSVLQDALKFGIDPSLEGVTVLMQQLGDPQLNYPCIQIAGTNGKSSTSRFTAAFLRAHGKKVGLYTSPELIDYPERMEIDGVVVSQENFACAVLAAKKAADEAVVAGLIRGITEFELLTAAALWLFAEQRVDYAVLEVGMGGRWDATSVVNPQVAVITGIDLDHTTILGSTVEAIAAEKAAIIKRGSLPVLGPGTANTKDIFIARCKKVGAPPPVTVDPKKHCSAVRQVRHVRQGDGSLVLQERKTREPSPCLASPLDTSRFPSYQKPNIACALAATQAALGNDHTLEPSAIQQALNTLNIPGRFELLRTTPPLLIDAAHNPQSARVLAQALIERYGLSEQSAYLKGFDTLLLGVLADKDAAGIIKALAPLFKTLAVTQSASSRAIAASELAKTLKQTSGREALLFSEVPEALAALTQQGAAVVATGSITLAGEIKRHICVA